MTAVLRSLDAYLTPPDPAPVDPPQHDPAARHAALVVCSLARDVDDADMLIDALGLLEDGWLVMPNPIGVGIEPADPKGILQGRKR